jgi:hypothetical protein
VRPREAAGSDALTVAAAPPSLDRMKRDMILLQERLDAAELALAAQEPAGQLTPGSPPQTPPPPLPDSLDGAAFSRGLAAVRPTLDACDDGTYRGTITATLTIAPDGGVTDVRLRPARTPIAACVELALRGARFDLTKRGTTASQALSFTTASRTPPGPGPRAACDGEALNDKAMEAYASGNYAVALVHFEAAYACKPELRFAEKALVVACNIPNLSQARKHWARITPMMRQRVLMICVRNAITEDMLNDVTSAGPTPTPTPTPMRPANVPPTVLEPRRTAGSPNIAPDDRTKAAIRAGGETKIIGSFKLCITAAGVVSGVASLKSTGHPAYDAKIQREMLAWRYRPYEVNGKAVPVCTAVTFIYAPSSSP